MNTANDEVRVWDRLVRFGHWLLVAGFFTAYLTEDEPMIVHVWSGYLVGVVVLLRIGWGLVGTRHARFTDFVRNPSVVWSYLQDTLRLRAERYLGHNPLGGVMIVALLVTLAVTVISGLGVYAAEENAGPLAGWITARSEDLWEEVHEVSANLTLLLVMFHVLGVLFSSLAHRENLVRSMITGRKRP